VLHDIDNDVFFAEEGSLDGKPFYGAVATDAATGKRICYEVCKDFKFWVAFRRYVTI
jgi:aldose 1-epimerase